VIFYAFEINLINLENKVRKERKCRKYSKRWRLCCRFRDCSTWAMISWTLNLVSSTNSKRNSSRKWSISSGKRSLSQLKPLEKSGPPQAPK